MYREADHEDASEDNDEGLVDMDDEEDKDESSFDERLGGSSATLLNTPWRASRWGWTPWPPWWDSLLLLLLVKLLLLAKCLEVLELRTEEAGWPPWGTPPAVPGGNPAVLGAVDEELFRIRARSSVNLA